MTQGRYKITINGFLCRRNKEEGRNDPTIRLDEGEKTSYHRNIKILGPSQIIQADFDPEYPNKPYIWIETDGPIEYD